GPGWRWVFLINLPLAAIVVIIAQRHVPESRDIHAPRQLDLPGAVLGAVGLGGVTYALIAAGGGWSPRSVLAGVLGLAAVVRFVAAQSGALALPLGRWLPMCLAPIVAACGLLLLLRVGPNASYLTDVLPGVTRFGLGLALIVAPLTTTVLAPAESRHAGIAS